MKLLEERFRDLVKAEVAAASHGCRYASKERLAELLGVELRTIKTWRSKGLPGVRVGREVMYEVDAVERWIEGH